MGGVVGRQGPGRPEDEVLLDDGREVARVVSIGAARSAGAAVRGASSTSPADAHLLAELHGLLSPEGALPDRLDRREVLLHLLERQRTRRRHRSA